jgi:hypothetical protein
VLHFIGFDQTGLIEIDQSTVLGVGRLQLALKAPKLGGKQLVVGCRGALRERMLPCDKHVGTQQCVTGE